jgi:hypothetical protein
MSRVKAAKTLAGTGLCWFVLVAAATAVGPRVAIITSEFPPPLVQRAANELKADLQRLFDAQVELGAAVVPGPPAQLILLGTDEDGRLKQLSDPLPKLSEQGHAVLSRKYKDRPALAVVGGSPAATYWAAAELAHQLGVRSLLYGDLDAVAPPEFTLKGFDIVREPLVQSRTWQMDFDSPLGPATWSLADQQKLLRQLARLKFNRLVLSSKADTPAAAVAAFRPIAVSGDTAGRSAFGGAKLFQNPDLAAADTAAARREAAETLIQAIEHEAKSLGMTVETIQTKKNAPPAEGSTLPLFLVSGADEQLRAIVASKRDSVGIQAAAVGDADLAAFVYSRGCFGANLADGQAINDLVTPVCGEGVSERVLKAFGLVEGATNLIARGDPALGVPAPDAVLKHYASSEPPPEWWGKARDNYLNAMNEMYRANTRAREGGRSYTLYFARRFEFAFEYMNSIEALRKAAIAKSKGDAETQIAELEKAVESLNGGLNALAAVARSQSDRGMIAALNEYGYRPLVKELEAAQDAAAQ